MRKRILALLTCWDFLPFVFHHNEIRVVHEFGGGARKLRCDRCGRYFAMSDRLQVVLPWDAEFERLYCDTLEISRTIR
jgi:hypothetical protein